MSLSAARVINYRRHLRALSICLFLVLAPVILMAVLWKLFPVGTWLLAVSAFCVEVVVKGKYCYSKYPPTKERGVKPKNSSIYDYIYFSFSDSYNLWALPLRF